MPDRPEKPQERPILHGGYSQIWRRAVRGDLDGRSIVSRAVRELKEALISDLGGPRAVSTGQTIIIDRIVVKTLRAQAIEHRLLEGREVTMGTQNLYLALCGSIRRDLQALGLDRRMRAVGGKVVEEEVKYDLSKLSLAEQIKLKRLLQKAKGLKVEAEEGAE